MKNDFHLSPSVLARYQALRLDSNAKQGHLIVPLGTLFWSDEHPNGFPETDPASEPTMVRLMLIRTKLWRTGVVSAEDLGFWLDAQKALPQWPGFERLELDEKLLARLLQAEEEADSFFVSLAADSDEFWADLKDDDTIVWRSEFKRPKDGKGEGGSEG